MNTKSNNKKAIYFFCMDATIDYVASNVFKSVQQMIPLKDIGLNIDNYPVLEYCNPEGNIFWFVRTSDVISHNYEKFLPILTSNFSYFDFAGVVNWHEGNNAPQKIFCVHTTGDVASGNFGKTHPHYMRNLIVAINKNRLNIGLTDFRVSTEATHWSGIHFCGNPNLIKEFSVPLVDIEIGSSTEDWLNLTASKVLAESLIQVFSSAQDFVNVLCVGGIHFEPSFAEIELSEDREMPIAVSHILPNQWLASGEYNSDKGLQKFNACIQSIIGGISGIIFHKSLKGRFKQQLYKIGQQHRIPVINHHQFNNNYFFEQKN